MGRSRSPSTSPKAPPPPTDLNLSALEDALAEAPDGTIRRVPAVHAPHLRRCINAGLLEPAAGATGTWRLSTAGVAALAARRARHLSAFAGFQPLFINRELLAQTVALAVSAGALSSAEAVLFLSCWDRPSTVADALAALRMPPVFAEALQPSMFTTTEARDAFTLRDLLAANRDWPLYPADVTAIASLHPGETYELRLGAGGDTILRCEGAPLRERCSTLARRLSNVLALYGKVLLAAR